jgi:hypothetical protein
MLKGKTPAARSLYEEILEQQFGGKKGKTAPRDSRSPIAQKQSSEFIMKASLTNKGTRSGSSEKTGDAKGTLAQEETVIMQRIFAKYADSKEPGKDLFMKLNRFKKLIHDARIPACSTAIELMFYGENRHQ